MKSIFSVDNPVFQAISRIGDMFILSFLWLATSLPVITIGASTTALMSAAIKIIRKRDTNVVKDYFRAFKENFRQSTLIFLIMLALGAVLGVDFYYWITEGGDNSVLFIGISAALAIPYLSTLLFVFPVQAVFENKIKDTLRTAFLMSIKHWPTSLVLALLFVGLVYLCDTILLAAFIVLIFGSGLTAFILATRFTAIFAKYNEEIAADIAKDMEVSSEETVKVNQNLKAKKTKVIR